MFRIARRQFPVHWTGRSVIVLLFLIIPADLPAKTSEAAKQDLVKLLLGKDVKSLLDLPATKEGVDVYFLPPEGKRLDDRGLDMADLTKWLKAKGIGVEAQHPEMVTNVKVDNKSVEIHLGGGGEGRRGSNHANKVNAGYERAGGSRVNFRYAAELNDRDIQPETFLKFMSRILDTSEIQQTIAAKGFSAEIQRAIAAKSVSEGMTYQMVQMSFGDPEQKKINDTTDGSFSETWYYLKEGHRWVLTFVNGKVAKIQAY